MKNPTSAKATNNAPLTSNVQPRRVSRRSERSWSLAEPARVRVAVVCSEDSVTRDSVR
ncbi:hypothetical protein GCM10027598_64470 [Amycolatopsis oliviviridis]|uniref:Uncharacterized protein n=1 Tax=Amycolatopsis oliviviridis TaxID=1471590 RepID=A0ABQ3M8Z2_9PSEU|nr:hypothetical protein GCM10017790_78080 [Amycolatopsis oliviviridis]